MEMHYSSNENVNNALFFLIFVFMLVIILAKIKLRRTSAPIPPGPFSWPVIGNLLQLRSNPHIKLKNMAQTYGPIMSLRLGARLVVVGLSPKAASEILKTHDSILSARHLSYTHPSSSPKLNKFAIGFAKECNEHWKNLRSICRVGLFSARAVQSQVKIREKNVANLVKYLHTKEGEVVDMSDLIFKLTLNTMGNILFSMDLFEFGPEENHSPGAQLKVLIAKFINLLASPNLADIFPILRRWDIQGKQKMAKDIHEKMFTIWNQTLKERREKKNIIREDFLDTLLDIGFNDDQINHLLLELLLAGTDTTKIIIIWALSNLIKNKNEMYKVRVELQTNIGDKILEESDIMVLPYLQACVKETIRMHPPIPFLLPHRATETCNVMNFTIPKGSQVLVNTWAMANDPSIWDDPSSYRPERFLDSGIDFKGNNFEFVPFGLGRRMCPGLPMAFAQVQYVVVCLVNTFNWFVPRDNDLDELDMEEVYHLAMRKKNPLEVIPRAVNQWIDIMKIGE
ncbi:hypothetical protein RD792_013083 [Penstemon davidsonii]|uniref:Cytochrome P450 n=1 Tax=Penstemon davidsonii TaxID=160366 RepID=A0ABR0CU07_9LAMI|nr:hypothetical protein RD792_013083 [Penstemon davidsonii]